MTLKQYISLIEGAEEYEALYNVVLQERDSKTGKIFNEFPLSSVSVNSHFWTMDAILSVALPSFSWDLDSKTLYIEIAEHDEMYEEQEDLEFF
jgi:hypothetical protein